MSKSAYEETNNKLVLKKRRGWGGGIDLRDVQHKTAPHFYNVAVQRLVKNRECWQNL